MTDITRFTNGTDRVVVEVDDNETSFTWRMGVNGEWSAWTSHYSGILVHKGYGLVAAYFDPDIREFHPFQIHYTDKA